MGWSAAEPHEVQAEPRTRVAFDLESLGPEVRVTVNHQNLVQGSRMQEACRAAWPTILGRLKAMLEDKDA